MELGAALGDGVGPPVGAELGTWLGSLLGPLLGDKLGSVLGSSLGTELGSELGQWEIEYEYDRVIMGGKKLYAFHHRGQSMTDAAAWKLASKGARLTHEDLIKIAAGKTVTYRSIAPTFSVAKSQPSFINRDIKQTAEDSRIVPPEHDPMFS